MKTTTEIRTDWSEYDKVVAQCQLMNYGKIYLDEYDVPIDDEHDYKNKLHKVFQSYYLNTKGFGDNEEKIMKRVLHIYQIRKITGKWYDK